MIEASFGLHWWSVNIGTGNGLVPSGKKPLHEPMLTQISCRHMTSLCHNELTRMIEFEDGNSSNGHQGTCSIEDLVQSAGYNTMISLVYAMLQITIFFLLCLGNISSGNEIDGLVQDCGIFSANTLETPQSSTKLSRWYFQCKNSYNISEILQFCARSLVRGSMLAAWYYGFLCILTCLTLLLTLMTMSLLTLSIYNDTERLSNRLLCHWRHCRLSLSLWHPLVP